MPKIEVLSEELINKIAAGEVIERPASVVKELVENSLDAGATRIIVEVKEYGQKLIKVIDNGEGMEPEDAFKAVLRHATSKIRNTDDLFAINTLGFRGEALASIAAVSRFTLTTKTKNSLEGFSIILEGGNLINSGIVAAEKGTIIEVENLFFNTPARKKFLKSDAVELKHIVEVIERYALIFPKISFRLIHDLKEILHSPSVEEWKDNLASIYGTETAKKLLPIESQKQDIKVSGYICKPYDARNDKTQQALFVNHRWVRNEELNKVIYEAYHSLLFVNKHPIYVINIDLNPTNIDVNIHPTKAEIKIEQIKEVSQVLFDAVREALRQNDLIPVMDLAEEQQLTFGTSLSKPNPIKAEYKYAFESSQQKTINVQESEREYPLTEETINNPTETLSTTQNNNFETEINTYPQEQTRFNQQNNSNELAKIPPFKLLGQIHKTFFVAETVGGMLIIDQHVVQERVLYERFMEQLLNRKVAIQHLLKGEVLELTAVQKATVMDNIPTLKQFGFDIDEFGENSFVLKSIPEVFGRLQPKELMFEIIAGIFDKRNRLEEIQEEIITRMACRASVKAGDTLTNAEMQNLLNQLNQTKFPYTCPHGRAVLIKIPVDELEKKFRRK
jgi:DNA mismatch repair protein MutL